jgi:DNA invertase Pin-like site-specific DNA recombinase
LADCRPGFSGAYERASEGTKTSCFWYTLDRVNKHVAIYARVSTGEQTPDNQLQELRAVAERMDWHVVAEYIDHGISGAKGRDQRPGYDQLYDAIVRREIDLVMAWSVDRLGRSLQQLVALLSDLQAKGVDLYLHQQGIDTTTAAGKAMYQMCGVFAEFERAMIRERVRAGLERARSQGKTLGRPRTPEIVEERIRAARRQGKGIKKIATELGIGVSTVQRVVHGPAPAPGA